MASPPEHASPRPVPLESDPTAPLWRALGPMLAALVVLAGTLPGLLCLPPVDRDEARFAQASAQMLETGDIVDIRFQAAPRDKKPVGIHWLQALAVRAVSSVERREVWAYRLPSLAGAMVAAAALAWAAQAMFEPRRSLLAGVILGCGWLLQTEAELAKTDAALCGATTLALAGLCRIYVRARDGGEARPGERAALWLGLAMGVLIKGPVTPLVVGLTLLALAAADRDAGGMRRLSWRWGLLFTGLVVAPWALAVTVSTDGGFWLHAAGGDIAAKLLSAQEHHGAPPGAYLLLSPLLVFPAACLAPAALSWGWRNRRSAGARFALAWLIPAWLVFEAAPTKLPNYVLPMLPALALLAAGALSEPIGRISRWSGAALSTLAGVLIAVACLLLGQRFGGRFATATALFALASGLAGTLGIASDGAAQWRRLNLRAAGLIGAAALGLVAHGLLTGGLLPSLEPLWPSAAAARLLARSGLDPHNGVTPGPVAVAGYAEPSLVFLLGTDLDLVDGSQAALALEDGRPALVEDRQSAAFLGRLAQDHVVAERVGRISGLDYSDGHPVRLALWRLASPATPPAGVAPADAAPTPP